MGEDKPLDSVSTIVDQNGFEQSEEPGGTKHIFIIMLLQGLVQFPDSSSLLQQFPSVKLFPGCDTSNIPRDTA